MKRIMMICLMALMVTSAQAACVNLIVNGDFESGDTGFSSDYTYAAPAYEALWPEATYTVYTNTNASGWVHPLWTDYGDHATGSGLMLIVNGAEVVTPGSEPNVWGQDVTVEENKIYTLTYYLRTCYPEAPATLRCTINDVQVGPDAVAPATPGDGWLEVSYEWNSESNTLAEIRLLDLNYAHTGNDFTIDDISFCTEKAEIEKEMDDEGNGGQLGENIEVTLTVDNPYGEAIKVEDVIPDGLKYIPGTFEVDGSPVVPTIVGNTISTYVDPGEDIEVTFDLQVVEVQCEDVDVTNTANVYDPEDGLDDDSEVDITLEPYEGFSKVIATSTEDDPYYVPMHKDVHWLLLIEIENIPGDDIITMEDVVVKDNLGGDLEMHWCYSGCEYPGKKLLQPLSQTPTAKKKGKTDKLQLSWDLDDLGDDTSEKLYLEISTDKNPGQKKKEPGKNEYTSEGDHDLNSGATLKFTDPDTGLQLSAHACPITVEAWCAPDLIVTELVVTFASDTRIDYDYTIENIGCGPADGDIVKVQAYLSDDEIFGNAGDIPAGGTLLNPPPGTLYPGDTFSGSWYATPIDATQHEYLTLMVDWGEVVDESDETNNTAWAYVD